MSVIITPPPNVTSIVPIFRNSGFDAEATRNLGKAYDDVRELMTAHKELASLLLQDPDLGYR
jgi:hypothetical protein